MDFKERNISLGHKLTKETLSIDLNEDWDPEILFWDPLPEISGSLLGNLLILAAVFGFVTSIMCYIYITNILCTNEFMKILLKWYTIELISCFTIVIIGHMTLAFNQNIWTCLLSLTPTLLLWVLAFNTSMCISGIRYYTKYKAQKSKAVNPKRVITFIIFNKIFCYLILIVTNILPFWYGLEVEFVVCANKQSGNWYIRLIIGIIAYGLLFFQILASIVFELKLKQLFKAEKRSATTQPAPLLPWRIVGQNLEANKIPQKSTYISTYWILSSILIISIYEALVIPDESPASELNFQCTMLLISSVLLVFHLPIILVFTFDYKINTVGILTQPPTELQFNDVRNNTKHSEEVESSMNPISTGNKILESVF